MNETEILEGNKLISEFMEYKEQEEICLNCNSKYSDGCNYRGCGALGTELRNITPEYNLSWGWLMPVVEKIEKHGYGFHIAPYAIEVVEYLSGAEKTIIEVDRYELTMIEMYYQATIEFIKWHKNL